MKTAFILLAFVACAFAANGTFTQKVCSDAKCSQGCQSNSFPEGQCIPVQGGGSIICLCSPSDAPTELNQTYYQDSTTCTGASQNQISPLNKCQQDSSGSYFENLCTKAEVAGRVGQKYVMAKVSPAQNDVLITDEHVASINRVAKTWTASADQGAFFKGATKRQIMGLMGVKKNGFPAVKMTYPVQALPDSFDAMEKWPTCTSINTIRDQSACGSCWAFGAAEAMSDRYCTYGGPANISISANDLVACCGLCGNGCDGGDPDSAWATWVKGGLVQDSCDPYPFPQCEHHIPVNHFPACPSAEYPSPKCKKVCNSTANTWAGSLKYGTKSWSLSGEQAFQTELFTNGPFEVAFDVYEDFPTYKSGVYTHVSGGLLGGHAVKITGWGTLAGTPYWKIANSWNPDWGMTGFFLIARGNDECGIEDSGSAGSPKL